MAMKADQICRRHKSYWIPGQIKRIIIDSSIIDFIICRVSEWLSIASGVWFVLNVPANGHRVESRTKNLPELVRDAA